MKKCEHVTQILKDKMTQTYNRRLDIQHQMFLEQPVYYSDQLAWFWCPMLIGWCNAVSGVFKIVIKKNKKN